MSENQTPVRWADRAMFKAEPHANYKQDMGVLPRVMLLNMTEDPLGSIAAMTSMYAGRVIRSLDDLSEDDRERAWENATSTHLAAPLEAVKFQFMIDGVDRAFTHQMVRQRTANFAQESLRFAVVDNLAHGISLPPSALGDSPQAVRRRELLMQHAQYTGDIYSQLIGMGTPAEDARSVLPQSTATRIFYDTNLRNLLDHAGNRLCTQAQFHWRSVFHQIVAAIGNYGTQRDPANKWQYRLIANSGVFVPVCYKLGRCPFKADFDRACSIRQRVDILGEAGVPSADWSSATHDDLRIDQGEWFMDPAAARVR